MLSPPRATTVDAVLRDLAASDMRSRIVAAQRASQVVASIEGEHDADQSRSRVVDALRRLLQDAHADVRAAAVVALADLGASEALAALLVAAEDDVAVVRQLALSALGEIGDPRARERVRRALKDERAEVRFQAIVAFPRLSNPKRLGEDAPGGEGDAALEADAWAALGGGLADEDPLVRARAAEACAELADGAPLLPSIGDKLAEMVESQTEPNDARVAAAIALAESGDRRGAPRLLDVIRRRIDEPDMGRVQAAFELAGELGLKEAEAVAETAAFGLRARFGDPSRRAAALVTLVRLGHRRAIDHVLAELDARSFTRRAFAIGMVGRAALEEARPRLLVLRRKPTLADPDSIDEALRRLDEEITRIA